MLNIAFTVTIDKAGISIMRPISALLIALALTGCATQAQRQAQQISTTVEAANNRYGACVGPINNDQRYQSLLVHTPLNFNLPPTTAQMAETAVISEADVALFSDRLDRIRLCRTEYLSAIMGVTPTIAVAFDEGFNQSDQNALALLQRRESWGQYVQNGKAISSALSANIVTTQQRLVGSLEAQHQQEMANRQAAAAAFSNSMAQLQQQQQQQQMINQQQQMINNMNRPVNTTCNRNGYTVNCTSN